MHSSECLLMIFMTCKCGRTFNCVFMEGVHYLACCCCCVFRCLGSLFSRTFLLSKTLFSICYNSHFYLYIGVQALSNDFLKIQVSTKSITRNQSVENMISFLFINSNRIYLFTHTNWHCCSIVLRMRMVCVAFYAIFFYVSNVCVRCVECWMLNALHYVHRISTAVTCMALLVVRHSVLPVLSKLSCNIWMEGTFCL